MTSSIRLHFLGTGTSVGVPQIGCACSVCRSSNPKNKRLRSSIILDAGETRVLVDSSPDLRQQALRANITDIDAIVYTHEHLDHIAGFDDLRAFCWRRDGRLPLYASPGTMATLKTMFSWAFAPNNDYQGYVRPDAHLIEAPFSIGDLRFTPVPVDHASVQTLGFLVESGGVRLGYACDIKSLPETSVQYWQNLDCLVLDALRFDGHSTHMTVAETLGLIDLLKPKQAYLTHMSHGIDYQKIVGILPPHVHPAYDQLTLEITKDGTRVIDM